MTKIHTAAWRADGNIHTWSNKLYGNIPIKDCQDEDKVYHKLYPKGDLVANKKAKLSAQITSAFNTLSATSELYGKSNDINVKRRT